MPNPIITAGTSGTVTLTAVASPAVTTHNWEIWSADGSTLLAHSGSTAGWTVTGSGSTRSVTPPTEFGSATNLELRVLGTDLTPIEESESG